VTLGGGISWRHVGGVSSALTRRNRRAASARVNSVIESWNEGGIVGGIKSLAAARRSLARIISVISRRRKLGIVA